jgi:hypothetical protein
MLDREKIDLKVKNFQLLEVNDAQARTIERLDADMTMVRKSDRVTIERLSYKVREAAESESAAYRRGRQDARDTILRRFDETEMPPSYYKHIIDRAVPPKVKPGTHDCLFCSPH